MISSDVYSGEPKPNQEPTETSESGAPDQNMPDSEKSAEGQDGQDSEGELCFHAFGSGMI